MESLLSAALSTCGMTLTTPLKRWSNDLNGPFSVKGPYGSGTFDTIEDLMDYIEAMPRIPAKKGVRTQQPEHTVEVPVIPSTLRRSPRLAAKALKSSQEVVTTPSKKALTAQEIIQLVKDNATARAEGKPAVPSSQMASFVRQNALNRNNTT
jgi:hypothetical protein